MAIHQSDDDDDDFVSETRIINVQNRRVKPGVIRANTEEQRSPVKNTVNRQSTSPRLNPTLPDKPRIWAWLQKLFR